MVRPIEAAKGSKPSFSIKRYWLCLRHKTFQKVFLYTLGIMFLCQSVRVSVAYLRNRYFIENDQYAAVLISDYYITKYDYWVSPATFFGASPAWTHYFNNRGLKIRWMFRAKSTDLIEMVQDPNCQSIVLIGHGTYHSWDAVDKSITNLDLKPIMRHLSKKEGEWLQLTCATDQGFACRLGELVMKPENVFTYHRKVNSCSMIVDAITAFRYIKSRENHHRSQTIGGLVAKDSQ